jgi:hypothetical protein
MRPSTRLAGVVPVAVAAVLSGPAWAGLKQPDRCLLGPGSGTISQCSINNSGTVTLVNPTAAAGIDGATDMTVAGGGAFPYDQAGP